MRNVVKSFSEYTVNEQQNPAADTTVNTKLGQAKDQYEQIKAEIDQLWQDSSNIGGTGVNKVGVQTNIKKQIAEKYRQLADALVTLADAEFEKAKFEEEQQRLEQQQQDQERPTPGV